MPIEIVLAGPPRGKQRVKRAGIDGHAYTPEKTVSFEGRLAYAAQLVMGDRPPLEGALVLDMEMHFPVPEGKPKKFREAALRGQIRPVMKPDWDNVAKMTDALNLIVWVDDKQIVDGRARKFYSDRPRTVVRVFTIEEAEGVFG